MSKDKRRFSDVRKLVLANLPVSKRIFMRGHKPKANPDGSSKYNKIIEITKEIRWLRKKGKLKCERIPIASFGGKHIKRTQLVKNEQI